MNTDASKLSEVLPHVERLPHTRLTLRVRRFFNALADAVSWIWLLLVAVVVVNVTMRYLFGEGRVEFEEIQWHLYAIGFLLGMSACLDSDDHIRVDVFHDRMPLRTRAWIELYGLLLLFFPFVLMVLWFTVPFVQYSFSIAEVSDAPAGLPFRWAIKGVLLLSMLLLLVAGVSRLLRVSCFLFGAPRAAVAEEDHVG
ncbi:MAG: TRAP transporter small permease subunit [Xanthomonadales bacterium]|nr:TRAP transporter small permease subunit [Xanthomonadales bacterium]